MRRILIISKDAKIDDYLIAAEDQNCNEILLGAPARIAREITALPYVYVEPDAPKTLEPFDAERYFSDLIDWVIDIEDRLKVLEDKAGETAKPVSLWRRIFGG